MARLCHLRHYRPAVCSLQLPVHIPPVPPECLTREHQGADDLHGWRSLVPTIEGPCKSCKERQTWLQMFVDVDIAGIERPAQRMLETLERKCLLQSRRPSTPRRWARSSLRPNNRLATRVTCRTNVVVNLATVWLECIRTRCGGHIVECPLMDNQWAHGRP